MQSLYKSSIPALTCLLAGMLLFPLLSTVSLPSNIGGPFLFGTIASGIIFYLSRYCLKYENLTLSRVHLLPNKQSAVKLIIGLIIGAFITGIMLLCLFSLTKYEISIVEQQSVVSFALATMAIIPLALMEELLFRGYPFFRLSKVINIRFSILLTSILFALYHYNGIQNIFSLLLGPGIWGVLFAVSAYLSKSIAVPLGIHISANYLQAIFGLKSQFPSIWTVSESTQSNLQVINEEFLGVTMQLTLLVIAIAVFEFKNKKLSE